MKREVEEALRRVAQIVWDVKWESLDWLAGREPACDVILDRIEKEFGVDLKRHELSMR